MELGRKQLTVLLRIALGGVFLYAGVAKASNPTVFAGSVAAYQIFPYAGNYLVAAVVPWIELICGALLIVGWRSRAAAALAALLTMIFIVFLFSTVVRGLDIDCGCFRQGGQKTTAWTAIFRDLLLLSAAIFTFRKSRP